MNSHMMKPAVVGLLMLLPVVAKADVALVPAFDAGSFAQGMPNPFFPMLPGQSSTLTGTVADPGGPVHGMAIRTVMGQGPMLMGVATTAILVEEFEAGRIAERTTDYYATDRDATVWYFGEDVVQYAFDDASGTLTQEPGKSWRAGEDGAEPGILLRAEPLVGTPTFIGHAAKAGELDIGEIVATHVAMTVPAGQYDDVAQLLTTSASDREMREYSWFAKGVGLIRVQEDLSAAFNNPKIELALQP